MSLKRILYVNGTSVGITLPKVLTEIHGMTKGTVVELEEVKGGILIKYPTKEKSE